MSLDVYLEYETPQVVEPGSGIFVREDGQMRQITRAEWDQLHPDREPLIIEQESESTQVYSANITHNLNNMAEKAHLYGYLWRPEENEIKWAHQLIEPLKEGLRRLESSPEYFSQFDAKNGWGRYDNLVTFVRNYLTACKKYPDARVKVSR